MTEPREIKPFELDGKTTPSDKDFRIKPDEEVSNPKDSSVPTPVGSSDSDQIELEYSEETVAVEKAITPSKGTESGKPTSSPETSPGKTKQPVKL